MKRVYRVLFYVSGFLIQCFGLTLGTKTALGASAIISLPFTIGQVTGINFAIFNFLLYLVMIGVQVLLNKKFQLILLLQILVAFMNSLVIGVLNEVIPAPTALWSRVGCMALAIITNGVGGAMMVNTKFVPNVVEGLSNSIGEKLGRDLGFGKNVLDFTCVGLACCIGLVFSGKIIGMGIGTVFAMIFVGRVMSVFNRFFRQSMMEKAGVCP